MHDDIKSYIILIQFAIYSLILRLHFFVLPCESYYRQPYWSKIQVETKIKKIEFSKTGKF